MKKVIINKKETQKGITLIALVITKVSSYNQFSKNHKFSNI